MFGKGMSGVFVNRAKHYFANKSKEVTSTPNIPKEC